MNGWILGFAAGAMMTAAAGGALAQETRETETAIFAGGCFWCVESDFDHVDGVLETLSGFTGGTVENPTYEQVTFGDTGHREAVKITYDPSQVSYDELLTVFWHSVDPTDDGGQFCDRGSSYRTAIFATSPAQLEAAKVSKAAVGEALTEEVVTPILEAGAFYPAENYHQNYYEKNPLKYQFYRYNCGRDATIRKIWGEQAFEGIPAYQS